PGLLHLVEAGIVRREVYDDLALQQLVDAGRVPGSAVTPRTLQLLLASGRVHAPLRPEDLAFLQRHGILRPEVTLEGDMLAMGSKRCSADLR
ncbi:MAG TPA: acetyl-CoA hydrolase, partial [Rubrivivax sp.]|nr:acetyl-CoA hydrolase [Rubrivivax sp.]